MDVIAYLIGALVVGVMFFVVFNSTKPKNSGSTNPPSDVVEPAPGDEPSLPFPAEPEPLPLPEEAGKPVDKMTVKELKEFAEKNDINLGSARLKADILSIVKNEV